MKIAIIGSGISGLTAAYLLHKEHEITVFEAADRIGGHTATKDVETEHGTFAVDTGFIVYNDWTYPNFIRLLQQLNVQTQPTEMGFSVHCENTGLEYSGAGLHTLFAQKRNFFRLDHWRMLRDILRFNREATRDLQSGKLREGATLGEYLAERGYSAAFERNYLSPMGAAIWSASIDDMRAFPLQFFVQFFHNHGLLSVTNRPQWRVLKGGSRAYLGPLTQGFNDRILLNTNIQTVERSESAVTIHYCNKSGDVEQAAFDQVIFACHSDQALGLLAKPSVAEKSILDAIPYQNNEVVLHTDVAMLPRRKSVWSSWNYKLTGDSSTPPILTYNMNILQGFETPEPFCVTLNQTDAIDEKKILGVYNYAHPRFSVAGVAAQARWAEINGVDRTWFCGAYWRNGFHEDGVVSAMRVARQLVSGIDVLPGHGVHDAHASGFSAAVER